jgi:hypothetical protein
MVNIEPIDFPIKGVATKMNVVILGFPTNATTTNTYYDLLTSDDKSCVSGNYQLSQEEFENWGTDNNYINQVVAGHLGVVIIN